MPRPPIERTVSGLPRVTLFKPAGVPARDLEQLQLGVDELEAIRLVDLEGLSHEQAAEVMGVSRQTVGRVLERGRGRVAEALVGGKAILIGGGQYRVEPRRMCCLACQARWADAEDEPATACPECGATDVGVCWGRGDRCGQGRGSGHKGDCPGPRGGGGRGRGGGKGPGGGQGGGGQGQSGPGAGHGRGRGGDRGAQT